MDIPFVALLIAPPTSTPMPTLEETETDQIWYNTPTPVPSYTPTPQEAVLPILPATGGNDSGDGNVPSGSNQPLLPLTAAALGTSVLLAASSKREEREAQAAARLDEMQKTSVEDQAANLAAREACVDAHTVATVDEETPYVEVSTLAALAGVVKETFTGVWDDAVRISAADAPRVTRYTTGGFDLDEYHRKLASWIGASEQAYKDIYNEKQRLAKETETSKAVITGFITSQERNKEENTAQASKGSRKVQAKSTKTESIPFDYDNYAEYMRIFSSTGGHAFNDLSDEQKIALAMPGGVNDESALKAIRTYNTTAIKAAERAKADAIAAAATTALNKKMERDENKITQNMGPKSEEEQKIWDKFIRDENLTSQQNNVQKNETEQKKTLWGFISGLFGSASSSIVEAVRSSTPTLTPSITPTRTPSLTPTITSTPTVTNTPTITPTVTRAAEIKTPYPGKYEITYFTELPFKYPGGSLSSYLSGSTDGTRGAACYYGPGPNDTYWAEVTAKANLKKTGGYHSGIDFSLPLGTPLYWTGDHDAIWVGQDLRFGAGPTNFVVKTENEFALYGHSIPLTNKDMQIEYRCEDGSILGIDDTCNINPNIPNNENPELTYIGDEEYYSDGTVIHPGDLIGYSGENDAGYAHLHWEIRPIIDGKSLTTGCYINPLARFDPKLFNDWYDLIKEDYFDPNTPLDGYYEVYDNCPEVEE